jgi:dihydroorotase
MPDMLPLTANQEAMDDMLRWAASKYLVNYGFFVGATQSNLPDLLLVNPACGIKIFMGPSHLSPHLLNFSRCPKVC